MTQTKPRQYEVQAYSTTRRRYLPISRPRNDVAVALDEFRAYVRTQGDTTNIRLRHLGTGKDIRSHKRG